MTNEPLSVILGSDWATPAVMAALINEGYTVTIVEVTPTTVVLSGCAWRMPTGAPPEEQVQLAQLALKQVRVLQHAGSPKKPKAPAKPKAPRKKKQAENGGTEGQSTGEVVTG